MKIKHQQDFFSGLLFIVFGLGALYIASHYKLGSAAKMGAGYFPVVLALLLSGIGLVLLLRALRGTPGTANLGLINWRVAGLIIGGVVSFGLAYRYLGLIAAIVLLVIISSRADEEFSWRGTLANATMLSLACWLLFVVLLKLPLAILPAFLALT
jgi:Tripartite tricarboxylate transporter TctB family